MKGVSVATGENGCISNCGNKVANNEEGPDEFIKVAYFLGDNWNRPCLNLEANDIPTDYAHIHFAFANLTSDYQVAIGDDLQTQFTLFKSMTNFKRVISIGGWAFSTDPSTYSLLREATQEANRDAFTNSIVAFVEEVSPFPYPQKPLMASKGPC